MNGVPDPSVGKMSSGTSDYSGRLVKLVLVTPDGELLGSLAPFSVSSPWWQEVGVVVRGALENHGLQVTVLRLLEADRPRPHGGSVTYLAEVKTRVPTNQWDNQLDEHPLRRSWARPGGPASDVTWAGAVLAERGISRVGPAEQVRSWNLSSIWRIPVEGQNVWLKVVPPMFAHEGALLEKLHGSTVPKLLARQKGRLLLAQIIGEDLYDAPLETLLRMVTQLVDIQKDWIGRTDELFALGLPDWRLLTFSDALEHTIEANYTRLSVTDRATLASFLETFDDRAASVQRCRIPDTLVHGDFHPGNCRGNAKSLVIMDWGDSCVGHPLLDEPSFLDRVPEKDKRAVQDHWHREWSKALPHSDPDSASKLLAPIAAARLAVVYQRFQEDIEPSERPYHQADPADRLRRTADLVRLEGHVDLA